MMRLPLLFALLATPAAAEVPKVMTDIPPVQAITALVMGDLGTPGMFLEKGGDEHELSLRPSQMRDLAGAGLVVWVGPDLTPALASAIASAGVPALALLEDAATSRMDYASGGVNPHAWLDPDNAAAWAGVIADRLAAVDPDNAEIYRANAEAAKARIAALDAALATELAPLKGRPFLGWHDAYGYFAAHYGLDYLGGLAEGDEAPPGAARLAEVHDLAEAGGIACVFPEEGHDPAMIAALGPVKLGTPLDPVGSQQDPGPDAYDRLMQALAGTLAACLAP